MLRNKQVSNNENIQKELYTIVKIRNNGTVSLLKWEPEWINDQSALSYLGVS